MSRKKRKSKAGQPSPFGLRMPQDVKDWVAQHSERNSSSQNSEIIRALRGAMDAESRETRASTAS